MNATNHSQDEGPQASRLRRFTGRHRALVIAGAAGALLLGGGAAVAFAADDPSAGGQADDPSAAAGTDDHGTDDHGGDDWDDGRDDDGPGDDDWDDDGPGDDDDFQLPADAIGQDAAVEAARAEVAGDVRDIDLEGTADAPVWEIDLTDADGVEWDLYIDALDGTVLHVEADDHQDDDWDDDNDD